MTSVDLNCDIGEGCGNDAELMRHITSANIACGFHAGDEATMRRTVELALENGVAIGAHPGYRDRENFGRTEMALSFGEIYDDVIEQILALRNMCNTLGGRLHHLKPHGALYNQAARDPEIARAIAEAIVAIDNTLILYGLSGSHLISVAEKLGLKTASEVFADRTYRNDGNLTPRSQPGALITETERSLTQVLDVVRYGRVRSIDAIMVPIKAETICIHGDGENASRFASEIKRALLSQGIRIAAPIAGPSDH